MARFGRATEVPDRKALSRPKHHESSSYSKAYGTRLESAHPAKAGRKKSQRVRNQAEIPVKDASKIVEIASQTW
jgi:hypothetical protein